MSRAASVQVLEDEELHGMTPQHSLNENTQSHTKRGLYNHTYSSNDTNHNVSITPENEVDKSKPKQATSKRWKSKHGQTEIYENLYES